MHIEFGPKRPSRRVRTGGPLASVSLLFMEPPSFPRRRKTAAERRAQRHRSEARFLQRALNGLNDLQAHRGGTLTQFGCALRDALTRLSAATVVPHSPASSSFVPVLPHCPDADSAPVHEVPAEVSVLSADHSLDASDNLDVTASADPQSISGLTCPVVRESVDEAVDLPIQFPEPSSSDVQVSAVQKQHMRERLKFSRVTGDEPDVVSPQQLLGNDVSEAFSCPFDFSGDSDGALQCYLVLDDVRNFGAASKFALFAVQPFYFMVVRGLSFENAVPFCAPETPSNEITPKVQDDAGGVKHDCNQQ